MVARHDDIVDAKDSWLAHSVSIGQKEELFSSAEE
jgi:hypothetical protein